MEYNLRVFLVVNFWLRLIVFLHQKNVSSSQSRAPSLLLHNLISLGDFKCPRKSTGSSESAICVSGLNNSNLTRRIDFASCIRNYDFDRFKTGLQPTGYAGGWRPEKVKSADSKA
jgi:hypothetical protein